MPPITEFWQLILGAIAGVVWLVRLEGKTTANTMALVRLEKQRETDLESANQQRSELLSIVAEMRADIKTLLRGSGK